MLPIKPVEDWEVIFEPGSVVVVESIHGGPPGSGHVELQINRYDLDVGATVVQACSSESDVLAALREIGASEHKAAAYAPEIWRVMDEFRRTMT